MVLSTVLVSRTYRANQHKLYHLVAKDMTVIRPNLREDKKKIIFVLH